MRPVLSWKDQKNLLWHECSAIFVVDSNDRMLIFSRIVFPLLNTVPAGHVEKYETPLETARRELREETGIVVDNLYYLGHQSYHRDYCRHGSSRHLWHFFVCQIADPLQININKREGENPKWLHFDQIRDRNLAHAIRLGLNHYKLILNKLIDIM